MKLRGLLITLASLTAVTVLLCFAPVRRAVSDFLGVFRVRKFALIQLNQADVDGLPGPRSDIPMASLADSLLVREPGTTREVVDAREAAQETGFQVRVPVYLPEGSELEEFTLEKDAKVRVDLGRVLAGVGVVVPYTVRQAFQVGERRFTFQQLSLPPMTQMPGPDPIMVGTMLLSFMGISEEDAGRLVRSLDWRSMIVVQLPKEIRRLHEVEVDGVTGVLLEGAREEGSRERERLVLWQKGEIVYALTGYGIGLVELLRIADSLE